MGELVCTKPIPVMNQHGQLHRYCANDVCVELLESAETKSSK